MEQDNGISFDEIIYHTQSQDAPHSGNAAIFLQEYQAKTGSMTEVEDNPNLECQCEEYACHCRKQCFCRLFDGTYNGDKILKSNQAPQTIPNSPDHQFKCACSFDGTGGVGMINGGTMDCDCKIADCSCEKKCACKSKNL